MSTKSPAWCTSAIYYVIAYYFNVKFSLKTRQVIRGIFPKGEQVKVGRYLVHRDSIPAIGGGRRDVYVYVRIEYDHSDTRMRVWMGGPGIH